MAWAYPTGAENFSSIFTWSQEVTSNWFSIGMCFLLFSIIFISTIQFGAKKAIAVSSWITMFLGFLFWAMGIFQTGYMFALILLVGLSTISLWVGDD